MAKKLSEEEWLDRHATKVELGNGVVVVELMDTDGWFALSSSPGGLALYSDMPGNVSGKAGCFYRMGRHSRKIVPDLDPRTHLAKRIPVLGLVLHPGDRVHVLAALMDRSVVISYGYDGDKLTVWVECEGVVYEEDFGDPPDCHREAAARG